MGYSITIGELKVCQHPEDGLDSSCISFDADSVKIENAPAFGEPTDYTNSRWPSYSGWSECLEDAGMYDLFFDSGHLIGGHPGLRLVTKELVYAVSEAKQEFEYKFPNVKATYGSRGDDIWDVDKKNPRENSTYCRMVWLDFWLKWAIENCDIPVISNH